MSDPHLALFNGPGQDGEQEAKHEFDFDFALERHFVTKPELVWVWLTLTCHIGLLCLMAYWYHQQDRRLDAMEKRLPPAVAEHE